MSALMVSDDELVALAHSRGGSWARPLGTVNSADAAELGAAIARGYRSLFIRGLYDDSGPLGSSLDLALALVGERPALTAASVDETMAQLPQATRYELFPSVAGTGRGAAVTTRPGGVHTIAAIEDAVGVRFFADLAVVRRLDDEILTPALCLLVRRGAGPLVGGWVVGGRVHRLVRGDDGLMSPLEMREAPADVDTWVSEVCSLMGLDPSATVPQGVSPPVGT